jgi:flavin reductase (DIM6/NTAB) family NADH-FMN oxidoreductase RutF
LAEENSPQGITINSFTSVSLDPPLVLFCVDNTSHLSQTLACCRYYGVNVLNEQQQEYSQWFARRGQHDFDGREWVPGKTGVPLIPGALAQFECRLIQVVEAGDHRVLIGEVVSGEESPGRPLLYFDSGYRRLE